MSCVLWCAHIAEPAVHSLSSASPDLTPCHDWPSSSLQIPAQSRRTCSSAATATKRLIAPRGAPHSTAGRGSSSGCTCKSRATIAATGSMTSCIAWRATPTMSSRAVDALRRCAACTCGTARERSVHYGLSTVHWCLIPSVDKLHGRHAVSDRRRGLVGGPVWVPPWMFDFSAVLSQARTPFTSLHVECLGMIARLEVAWCILDTICARTAVHQLTPGCCYRAHGQLHVCTRVAL